MQINANQLNNRSMSENTLAGTSASKQEPYALLNQLYPEQARRFMLDQIRGSLASLGNMSTIQPMKAGPLTASSMAEDILGRAKSLANQHTPLSDIKSAINQSAASAESALTKRNSLPESLQREINDFKQQLKQGLGRQPFVQTESLSSEYRKQTESKSANIELTTKDGDKIVISVEKSISQESTQFRQSNGDYAMAGTSSVKRTESFMSIQIQGNLDADELKAVEGFIQKVNSLADELSTDNSEAIMQKAAELKFDNEQLSSFSVELQTSQSLKAVDMYQRVQQSTEANRDPLALNDFIKSLQNLSKNLENLQRDVGEMPAIAEPNKALYKSLEELIKLNKPNTNDATLDFLRQKLIPEESESRTEALD